MNLNKQIPSSLSYLVLVMLCVATFIIMYIARAVNESTSFGIVNYAQENPSTMEAGTVEVLHTDDFEQKKSTDTYFLQTYAGERLRLEFTGGVAAVIEGAKGKSVEITGSKKGDILRVDSTDQTAVKVESNAPNRRQTPTPTPNTSPNKKVAMIMLNFLNDQSQPYTVEEMRARVFSGPQSARAYFQEVAFGKVNLTGKISSSGDVFNWVTVPYNGIGTGCPIHAWSDAAKQVLTTQGYDMTGYDHYMYVFPFVSDCGFIAVSYQNDRTWYNGNIPLSYIHNYFIHELGHNMGASHASSMSCTNAQGQPVQISNTCTGNEYGDPFDVMASGNTFHMSSFRKGHLRWMEPANTFEVTTSGTYTIDQQETSTAGIKALKVFRTNTTYQAPYYYLEYRQGFGFDANHPASNTVIVRLGHPYESAFKTWILDVNPQTPEFYDAPLSTGNIFTDPDFGVSFEVLGTTATNAQVRVSITRPTPLVTPTPTKRHGRP